MSFLDRLRAAVGAVAAVHDPLAPRGGHGLGRLQAADGPTDRPDGGYYLPSDTTISQILDYVGGTSDAWPLDFYRVGLPLSRDVAVSFATLNRCTTLIAGGISELLCCGGSLHAVDRMGNRVTSRRVRQVIGQFSESFDGGESAALNTVEDLAADYALDGNALAVPDWAMDGTLRRLRRMSSWDSDLLQADDGMPVYRLTPANEGQQSYLTEYQAPRDVVHIRWPRLLRYGRTRSTREGFAQAPVIAMRPALDIGIRGDSYVRQWFTDGAKSKLHVNFSSPADKMAARRNSAQRRELVDYVERAVASRKPLVTFDGQSNYVRDTPADAEAQAVRDFQVIEVARVYGIPGVIVGVHLTSWGTGIEQLARLWWRFGLKHHLHRFLAPLSLRLLPAGVQFAVDPFEVVRGDSKEMTGLIRVLQGDAQRGPLASIEELRRMASLPREMDGEAPETTAPPASAPPPVADPGM